MFFYAILSQLNTVHSLIFYLFKISHNINLLSTPRSPKPTLKMETIRSSETLVSIYKTTRRTTKKTSTDKIYYTSLISPLRTWHRMLFCEQPYNAPILLRVRIHYGAGPIKHTAHQAFCSPSTPVFFTRWMNVPITSLWARCHNTKSVTRRGLPWKPDTSEGLYQSRKCPFTSVIIILYLYFITAVIVLRPNFITCAINYRITSVLLVTWQYHSLWNQVRDLVAPVRCVVEEYLWYFVKT
jgi:hypothetical protein